MEWRNIPTILVQYRQNVNNYNVVVIFHVNIDQDIANVRNIGPILFSARTAQLIVK